MAKIKEDCWTTVSSGTVLWTLSNCVCLYKIKVVNILAWMEEWLIDPTHTWDYWKLIAAEERSVHFHQRCGLCGLLQRMAPYTCTDAQDRQNSVSQKENSKRRIWSYDAVCPASWGRGAKKSRYDQNKFYRYIKLSNNIQIK